MNADYVFVLDKPVVSKEFIEEIDKLGLPLVWIDHHEIESELGKIKYKHLFVYNPAKNKGKEKSTEPVTYWCYETSGRKEDLWLAILGCAYDHYLPDFINDFKDKYPDFWGNVRDPFDAYFGTEIGKIARSLNFGLKDSITNVVKMQSFLLKCTSPGEVLEESKGNVLFIKKYEELRKRYNNLLSKAEECLKGDSLFFEYGGESSMSSELSNELSYRHRDKYIAVAFINGGVVNVSLRGKNVNSILSKLLKKFEKSSGGGHENAVGARITTEDLKMFKKALEEEISNI